MEIRKGMEVYYSWPYSSRGETGVIVDVKRLAPRGRRRPKHKEVVVYTVQWASLDLRETKDAAYSVIAGWVRCRRCGRGLVEHHPRTEKCLFGAGYWR
jgi:hypothetical protein